jgi:hypothetical protein
MPPKIQISTAAKRPHKIWTEKQKIAGYRCCSVKFVPVRRTDLRGILRPEFSGRGYFNRHTMHKIINSMRLLFCALIMTGAGCAQQRSIAIEGGHFDWTTATALMALSREDAPIEPTLKLQLKGSNDAMYFAELAPQSVGQGLREPLIVRKTNGQWLALDVRNDWGGNDWLYASAGPGKGEVWAVLDAAEEDRAWDLVLIHSTDAGQTWKMTALQKASYLGEFSSFVMGSNGQGLLTVTIFEDYTDSIKQGQYKYRTLDDGKTWTGPELEPDNTTPASQISTESRDEPFKR